MSNKIQAESSHQSKRTTNGNQADNLYARYRKLEQRTERLENALSTLRRDVYRIEKAGQRAKTKTLTIENSPAPVDEFAGLFGGK